MTDVVFGLVLLLVFNILFLFGHLVFVVGRQSLGT